MSAAMDSLVKQIVGGAGLGDELGKSILVKTVAARFADFYGAVAVEDEPGEGG